MTMTPDPSTFAAPKGDPKHTYDAKDVAGIDRAVAYVFAILSAYRNKKDTANPQEPFACFRPSLRRGPVCDEQSHVRWI